MQPSTTGFKLVTTNGYWFPNGTIGFFFVEPRQSWLKTVECGPMLKGNFVDPNPWNYAIRETSYARGVFRSEHKLNGLNVVDGIIEPDNPGMEYLQLDSIGRELAQATALDRLNEKVRGSLDLATSLAEGGQTIKMLNLVERLKSVMSDMRNSYKKEILRKLGSLKNRKQLDKAMSRWQRGLATRHPRAYRPVPPRKGGFTGALTSVPANGWLEYTYGLSPLISDIRGIAENIVGFVHNNTKVTASCTLRLDGLRREGLLSCYGHNMPTKCEYKGFVRAKYAITLRAGYDESLAKWTSLNPANIAWELFPYSFVIDWVLDVGSYLRNLETSLLYATKFVSGSFSTLIKYEGTSVCQYVFPVDNGMVTCVANGAIRRTIFDRSVLISYPAPRLPSFKLDLGASQLISAAALLRQLIK